MDQGFTTYNNDEETVITPELLQVIFDTIPTGIEMLKPMRDKKNEIVDFEYVLDNEMARKAPGYVKKVGKKFLSENGNGQHLFKKMAELADSGMPSGKIAPAVLSDGAPWFDVKLVKYGDAVIIFQENITKEKLAQTHREDGHFINQIVETSADIIYIMDLNTRQLIYTNRQISAQLGYSRQQIDLM